MIEISKVNISGWESAIRGMRNPLNSWSKSDSEYGTTVLGEYHNYPVPQLGENDFKLMDKLAKAGSDHAKYRRFITVTADVLAPLYWWKEYDTYKVGTVANSCSTMHKIQSKAIKVDDFSIDEDMLFYFVDTIVDCERLRRKYLETNDKKYWRALIQLLPCGYNQLRTVQLNYEVLANMYRSRRHHKLSEWVDFCKWIEELPYSELIIEG